MWGSVKLETTGSRGLFPKTDLILGLIQNGKSKNAISSFLQVSVARRRVRSSGGVGSQRPGLATLSSTSCFWPCWPNSTDLSELGAASDAYTELLRATMQGQRHSQTSPGMLLQLHPPRSLAAACVPVFLPVPVTNLVKAVAEDWVHLLCYRSRP